MPSAVVAAIAAIEVSQAAVFAIKAFAAISLPAVGNRKPVDR